MVNILLANAHYTQSSLRPVFDSITTAVLLYYSATKPKLENICYSVSANFQDATCWSPSIRANNISICMQGTMLAVLSRYIQ